jgi:hypothetical protein
MMRPSSEFASTPLPWDLVLEIALDDERDAEPATSQHLRKLTREDYLERRPSQTPQGHRGTYRITGKPPPTDTAMLRTS